MDQYPSQVWNNQPKLYKETLNMAIEMEDEMELIMHQKKEWTQKKINETNMNESMEKRTSMMMMESGLINMIRTQRS